MSVQPAFTPSVVGASSERQGITPSQICQAYGFDQITLADGMKGDGSGQTIAIVNPFDSATIAADLHRFDAEFAIPDPPQFIKMNQSGGSKLPAVDATWATETALDVEWAHAMAPGAKIVLVEASSATVADLATAIDTARHLSGVSVVSMSWGTPEFSGESAYDPLFTTPDGHAGVTFVAASGDGGSTEPAQWPAVSHNVLAVGGTNLSFANVLGTYGIETYSLDSTSGTSEFESAATAATTLNGVTFRTIPDVSYNASGYAVYDSAGGWQVLGGTSAAAPQWAALIAIADQGRASQGLPSADGATTTVPALYGASGTAYNAMGQGASSTAATSFSATGLGSPNAAQVVQVISGAIPKDQPTAAPFLPPTGSATKKHVKPLYTPYLVNSRPLGVPPIVFSTPGALHLKLAAATGPVPQGSAAFRVLAERVQGAVLHRLAYGSIGSVQSAMAGVGTWVTRIAASATHWIVRAPAAMTAVGPVEAVALPAPIQTIYQFAQVNALATFSDELGLFINECAALSPGSEAVVQPSHARAWAVTAVVVAADVFLLHQALHHRDRKKRAIRSGSRRIRGIQWSNGPSVVQFGAFSGGETAGKPAR